MKFSFILVFALTVFISCDKEPMDDPMQTEDPTGSISGQVIHHDSAIPSAIVYIKYNATEFPGSDLSVYDDQVTASDDDASYEFTKLGKGDYYLYGIGTDEFCNCEVKGGIPVSLDDDAHSYETDVPVTE